MELFNTLVQQGAIPPSRRKDLKTSLRYLARALDATPHTITDVQTTASHYQAIIRSYFGQLTPTPSIHTIRNTLNNLSFFFRQAHAFGLVYTIDSLPFRSGVAKARREAGQTSLYRNRVTLPRYASPTAEWPTDIREHWDQYQVSRQFEVRPVTLKVYEGLLSAYIGYGVRVEQPPINTWAELFSPERLTRFLQWHMARLSTSRITYRSKKVIDIIKMLAQYDRRPEFPAIKELARRLPTPEPMHDKQDPSHSISLKELDDVGLVLLSEARAPLLPINQGHNQHPGLTRATRFAAGLILRLLARIPLRQRNIREMLLDQNLYQYDGIWQLRFQGDELKIRARQGRINKLYLPFPDDLVENVEEYLRRYRPLLINADADRHVFLSKSGRPYSGPVLRDVLFDQVYIHIKKRFYPHLIRTIWSDAFLLDTHDISTAAKWLNNNPQTVWKHYHELRANDHIQKAVQFNKRIFGSSATSS